VPACQTGPYCPTSSPDFTTNVILCTWKLLSEKRCIFIHLANTSDEISRFKNGHCLDHRQMQLYPLLFTCSCSAIFRLQSDWFSFWHQELKATINYVQELKMCMITRGMLTAHYWHTRNTLHMTHIKQTAYVDSCIIVYHKKIKNIFY